MFVLNPDKNATTPFAVKVVSAMLATEAVNVLLPAVAPKVHAGAVATPLALV